MQENNIEMYILIWKKNYLATLSPKETPPETDSKTKIQKIQSCIHKNPKISGKHQQKKIPKKKIFKLKKLYQTSSPSKVTDKTKKLKKKQIS